MLLDKYQQEALKKINGQLLMVACPGSGKTTTLLHRINHMVTQNAIPESSILMVTFTKAAAEEMKARYALEFNDNSRVTFCTIHAFCFALMKKFSDFNGNVLSEYDASVFLGSRVEHKKNIGNRADFVSDLKLDFTVLKNSLVSIKNFKPKCTRDKKLFEELYLSYEDYKEMNNLIDFDDMQLMALDLMVNRRDVLSWVRNRYRYILVDEYQDINELQKEIIYLIAGKNGNLAVVGDDDQSIYGFRGAAPSIMFDFKKTYPNSDILKLGQNYRSYDEIVCGAKSLIENNNDRFQKDIIGVRGKGGRIYEKAFDSRKAELEYVVKDIKEKLAAGEKPEDIAILYRVNKQADLIAKTLYENDISFVSSDKISDIYDHFIFKEMCSFYRASRGLSTSTDNEIILNHPNRFLRHRGILDKGLDEDHMLQIVENQPNRQAWMIKDDKEKIRDFFKMLEAVGREPSPAKGMNIIYTLGGYRKYLKEYADYRNEDLADLRTIWNELFNEAAKCRTWTSFFERREESKAELEEALKSAEGVRLYTMHSAKGLEWKRVYIVDCVEGKHPYSKAKTAAELEEERRLFYVAMTRAKDELVLLRYESDGSSDATVSKYLKEIENLEFDTEFVSERNKDKVMISSNKVSYAKPVLRTDYGSSKPKGTSKTSKQSAPIIMLKDTVTMPGLGQGAIVDINISGGEIENFTVEYESGTIKEYMYPLPFTKGKMQLI